MYHPPLRPPYDTLRVDLFEKYMYSFSCRICPCRIPICYFIVKLKNNCHFARANAGQLYRPVAGGGAGEA